MTECCSVKGAPHVAPAVMDCPISGTRSKQVNQLTVKSLIRRLPFAMPATQYYFCAAPGCDVVYFPSNLEAPTFSLHDLLVRVGAKESGEEATICYCFGISQGQVRTEVEATGKCLAAEKIKAEIQAGRCACEVKNPTGKCCLGDITRAVNDMSKRELAR